MLAHGFVEVSVHWEWLTSLKVSAQRAGSPCNVGQIFLTPGCLENEKALFSYFFNAFLCPHIEKALKSKNFISFQKMYLLRD